jgi:hypothetical protein
MHVSDNPTQREEKKKKSVDGNHKKRSAISAFGVFQLHVDARRLY